MVSRGRPKKVTIQEVGLQEHPELNKLFSMIWDAGFAACYSWIERRKLALSSEEIPAPCNPCRDPKIATSFDNIAVSRFAMEMIAKLGCKSPDVLWDDKARISAQELSEELRRHVDKGDPVDVANYAMFLHQRGEKIL